MRITRAIQVWIVVASALFWGTASEEKTLPPVPTIQEQLIGTWKFVHGGVKHSDGSFTVSATYGSDPVGYISYDRTGHMSVQFMKRDRPNDGTTQGYLAYFGTFIVDEEAKTVTHHVEGSLTSANVGRDQKRDVILSGNNLTLVTDHTADGDSMNIFVKIN